MTAPEPAPATATELDALAVELGLDDYDALDDDAREALDGAVHDAKAAEAADINNGGPLAQIGYLCRGLPLERARAYLTELADGDDA